VAAGQTERAAAFSALHEGPPFLIPNPWDAGSAKVLAGLGYEALATTSSGFAFTLGRADGEVTLDEVCHHVEALDAAVEVPISADLENGFGPEPEDAARAISRAAEAGAVGGSIEDWDTTGGIYELEQAVERVRAAREAADRLDFAFTLTARAENHVRGNPDLEDTIARLRAYESAGADVLFAPGLATVEEIGAVCGALSKPVNVLARPALTFEEIAAAGAQRVSVGGALSRIAMGALAEAAGAIRESSDLSALRSGFKPGNYLDS